jgi:Uncharacterized conserved protein (DUF2190)
MSNTAGRKAQEGQAIDVTVLAATTLLQGEFAIIDGFHGFNLGKPKVDTTVAETRPLTIAQDVYETDQITTADAFTVGQLVNFDTSTKLFTVAAVAGNIRGPVGRVAVAKDGNNVIWMLQYPQRQQA